MSISFKTVTWYSQIIAIVLFVGVFALGYHLGRYGSETSVAPAPLSVQTGSVVTGATFACTMPPQSYISTIFYQHAVALGISDGRSLTLPQVISASGARYAHSNSDDSFVFWNKGNTAFVTENGTTTYGGCVIK